MLARMEFVGLAHLWQQGGRPAAAAYYGRVRQRPSFGLAPIYRRIDHKLLAYLGLRKSWPGIAAIVLGPLLPYLVF
jgi:hypothetical protein